MISPDNIKEIARKWGIPTTTVERDYVQNRFLISLYSKTGSLAFKGGTAIRKAYIPDYRFSDDLDFTLSEDLGPEHIVSLANGIVVDVAAETGIIFEDPITFKEVATGWKLGLHYNSLLSRTAQIKLNLDVTKFGKESILTPLEKHKLIHNYPDECIATLTTYSLAEIAAEKLRALCGRAWPRDLYDVHALWPMVENERVGKLFLEKCRNRGLKPALADYRENRGKLENAWSKSLEHQLRDVPGFEEVFEGVLRILESIIVN